MSNEKLESVTVIILGKEYRVACPPEAEEGLRKAARHLDEKMEEVKQAGKIIGTERIAVMVALNLANDLLERDDVSDQKLSKTEQKIEFLTSKVEQILLDLQA